MFETIEKAKRLGGIALERVDEYLELLRILAEIQGRDLKQRVIGFAVVALFAFLSLIFLGLAVIVTCWDTSYRAIAAWGVAVIYALIAFAAYRAIRDKARPVSAFDTLRGELRQDIELMKDVV
ncbi:MAG: phage holin family protein [Nitrosospira sp.]|nr:phage holin family protein [Nitrosospira sp.]